MHHKNWYLKNWWKMIKTHAGRFFMQLPLTASSAATCIFCVFCHLLPIECGRGWMSAGEIFWGDRRAKGLVVSALLAGIPKK
jgi:hypothetical protein